MTLTTEKILSLDALASAIAAHRDAGRTTVLCHGVFDLVHPGHIRHFEEARRQGDVLVVTVTPDHYVNKGPGRPVFNERLRSETIAALAVVDHVAINEWPTAIETIHMLKPDVYAKGSEYETPEDDLTGKIVDEEQAVREEGGRVFFTHDITFSSSHLLNAHFDALTPEASSFLQTFRSRFSADDVIDRLRALADLKVLVVGDAIVDEYVFCRAYGMASKSASIAAQELAEERYAGGAIAVANHLAGFCGSVELVTCLGTEDPQEDLIRAQLKDNVEPVFHERSDAPTTAKRRYVNGFLLTKMFETTRFSDAPLSTPVERALLADLGPRLREADLVIAADFGHGLIGPSAVGVLASGSRFLALNTQTNAINLGYNVVTRYPRADYVCIDAEEAHLAYRSRTAPLEKVIGELASELSARTFTITRGQHGAIVRGENGELAAVPTLAREVVDSIGAGDAFLALSAPLAALDATPDLIGFVGNAVGALAVRIIGNKESIEPVGLFKFVTALLK
jgi:rfaE bifunctional protein nucleotidyltransferase chain/domain